MQSSVRLIKILTVLLIVLSGILFLIKRENRRAQDESSAEIILYEVSGEDVSELTLSSGNSSCSLLCRDGIWVSASGSAVSQRSVDAILFQLKALKATRIIPASDASGNYGLEPPRSLLSFRLKNGEEHTIKLGDPAPIGDDYYLQLDDGPDVCTVSEFTASRLGMAPEELLEEKK